MEDVMSISMARKPSLLYYLLIAGGRLLRFISFPRIFVWNEMPITLELELILPFPSMMIAIILSVSSFSFLWDC